MSSKTCLSISANETRELNYNFHFSFICNSLLFIPQLRTFFLDKNAFSNFSNWIKIISFGVGPPSEKKKNQTINNLWLPVLEITKNAVAIWIHWHFQWMCPHNDDAHSMNKFRNNENKWHTQCKFKSVLKHFPLHLKPFEFGSSNRKVSILTSKSHRTLPLNANEHGNCRLKSVIPSINR